MGKGEPVSVEADQPMSKRRTMLGWYRSGSWSKALTSRRISCQRVGSLCGKMECQRLHASLSEHTSVPGLVSWRFQSNISLSSRARWVLQSSPIDREEPSRTSRRASCERQAFSVEKPGLVTTVQEVFEVRDEADER